MKIAIDCRFYGLEHGGLGRYTINLLNNLQDIDSKNEYFILLNQKYCKNLKLQNNFKKILVDANHYTFKEQALLPKILNNLEIDFAHFLHFNVPVFYKDRFLVTIHDLSMHKKKGRETTTLKMPLYLIKRFGYQYVFKQAINNSQQIIVPSKVVKKDILKTYKNADADKINVIYEGVDNLFFKNNYKRATLRKYNIDPENPYLVYTGNAYPHKNLKRAIDAVVQTNTLHKKEINFYIVTSRSVFMDRLKNMIKTSGAEKYVKIINFVEDDELKNIYHYSHAFLYPSLSEGFGLPALEAMASRTLTIVSDIPIFKEVYKDNVIYMNAYDFSAMAKLISNTLDISESDRNKKIEKAYKFAKKYNWKKMAKETLNLYEKNSNSLRQSK